LAIIEEWRNIGQRFIDRSINEWRQQLDYITLYERNHFFWPTLYIWAHSMGP